MHKNDIAFGANVNTHLKINYKSTAIIDKLQDYSPRQIPSSDPIFEVTCKLSDVRYVMMAMIITIDRLYVGKQVFSMDVLQNKGKEPYNSKHMRMTHHIQAGVSDVSV